MKSQGIAGTTMEAKEAVSRSEIQVNGHDIRDYKYPIGLSDVITVKKSSESYLVGIDRYAKATYSKADPGKALTYKLIRKYRAKGGKVMFGLHDGSIVEGDGNGRVNDSVEIDKARKIVALLKFEKGAHCIVIDGVHVGAKGTIKDIKDGSMHAPKGVTVESDGAAFETIVKNIMVTK